MNRQAVAQELVRVAREVLGTIPHYGIENLPEGVPQPPHADRNNIGKIIVEGIKSGRVRNEHDASREIVKFERDYGYRDTPEGADILHWFKTHQDKLLTLGHN
jgi:hypothetical protein